MTVFFNFKDRSGPIFIYPLKDETVVMIELIFKQLVETFAQLFSIVGAALIIFGGLKSILHIVLLEVAKRPYTYNHIRRELTDKIVFGLEFFIAADILSTLVAPTHEELILLGTVVVIRTLMGYFLSKEAEEYQLE